MGLDESVFLDEEVITSRLLIIRTYVLTQLGITASLVDDLMTVLFPLLYYSARTSLASNLLSWSLPTSRSIG